MRGSRAQRGWPAACASSSTSTATDTRRSCRAAIATISTPPSIRSPSTAPVDRTRTATVLTPRRRPPTLSGGSPRRRATHRCPKTRSIGCSSSPWTAGAPTLSIRFSCPRCRHSPPAAWCSRGSMPPERTQPGHCRWSSVSDRAGRGSGRWRRDTGSALTPPLPAQCPHRCGDSAGRGRCRRRPTRRRTPRSSSSTPRRSNGSCGCTTSISTAWLSTGASRRPRRDRLNCQRAIASACVTLTARSAACSRSWIAAGSSPARWW